MNNKLPCAECICMPICRYKQYRNLISECSDIMEILYINNNIDSLFRSSQFNKMIVDIEHYLKPTRWYCVNDTISGIFIRGIEE
jgi:hypothetical protein